MSGGALLLATAARPELDAAIEVLLLRDYNTRIVVLSTALLGLAAGLVGSFLLLRRRSLTGDALSHATLPGIAVAFLVMVAAGGTGKFLPGLLLGAAVSGLLGVGAVLLIRATTRLGDDAALGIVLSVFFGAGIALLDVVQHQPAGSAAGLQSFIYGKTASIVRSDLLLIGGVAVVVGALAVLLTKELTLLCFDEDYAGAQGWPVTWLDVLLMTLVTIVTVIGLQAVGLILVIALLITPPAAARFWTDRLRPMLVVAAIVGVASGWIGASISALVPRLPAGAVIVLVAATLFAVSLLVGPARGVLPRAVRHVALVRRVSRHHLLRAMYEAAETTGARTFTLADLLPKRSWSRWRLRRLLASARRRGWVVPLEGAWRLTDDGRREGHRVVRNHRLWEHFLITHADIAPSHVDRGADRIEHVLGADLVERLERSLGLAGGAMPESPHRL